MGLEKITIGHPNEMNLVIRSCCKDNVELFISFATVEDFVDDGVGILEKVRNQVATFDRVASVGCDECYIEPVFVGVVINNNIRGVQVSVDKRIVANEIVSHSAYHPFKIFKTSILYYKI